MYLIEESFGLNPVNEHKTIKCFNQIKIIWFATSKCLIKLYKSKKTLITLSLKSIENISIIFYFKYYWIL